MADVDGVEANHDASLEFLRLLYPNGPWCLIALGVENIVKPGGKKGGKPNMAATFRPGQEAEVKEFLWDHRDWNIYYHVNEPRRDIVGHDKAHKQDIERVHFFHVDLDLALYPTGGKDEKDKPIHNVVPGDFARLHALFDRELEGIPRIPGIVESGGGINALWRLDPPITIIGGSDDARVAMVERIEDYNIQIRNQYSRASVYDAKKLEEANPLYKGCVAKADHCQNIDRILRLPGTINWPDAVKRSRGRVPALAKLVRWEDVKYPITSFTPFVKEVAEVTQEKRSVGSGVVPPRPSSVERLASLDHMVISEELKHIIITGDTTKQHGDRSATLFFVICELDRSQIPYETIWTIITDPKWGISASVLDKQDPEDYAERQIKRARDKNTGGPHLMMMNERHVVIRNMQGECVVLEEVDDGSPRSYITFSSFAAIKNSYNNIKVATGKVDEEGNHKKAPLGTWWLDHRQRNQKDFMVFDPERKAPANCYNLWRGFAVKSEQGDCHRYLDHLKYVCNGDLECYEYILNWMALAVQKPARPGHVAIVFRGDPGAGKGTIINEFGALWGRHYFHLYDPAHLTGNFNYHLRDTIVLFADEAIFAGNKKDADILRGLVTEGSIVVTKKYADAFMTQNFLHIMMASNHEFVIPAQGKERRYLVIDVPWGTQSKAYFDAIYHEMENGGRQALLYMLKNRDVSPGVFDPRQFPKTAALHEQKILALSPENEWWLTKLQAGTVTGREWEVPVPSAEVYADYLAYAQALRLPRPKNITEFGKLWGRVLPKEGFRHYQHYVTKGSKPYHYQYPPLAACRAHWEEHVHGSKYNWNDDTEEGSGTKEMPF